MSNKIYVVIAECFYEHYDTYSIVLVTEDKDKAISYVKEQELLVSNALSIRYIVHERDLNVSLLLNNENVVFEKSSEE